MSLTLGDLVPGFFHSLQRQRPGQRPHGRTSCRNFYLSECLMAKSILNFHFDYWNPSLNWNLFWSGCKHLGEKKQQERRYHLHAYCILHIAILQYCLLPFCSEMSRRILGEFSNALVFQKKSQFSY